MNNCIVKFNREGSKEIHDSDLFLEDFLQHPNIKKARELTDQIFIENSEFISRYIYDDYKITWSWYDNVYQIALDFISIKSLVNAIESTDPQAITLFDIPRKYTRILEMYFVETKVTIPKEYSFYKSFQEFLFNFILLFFTIISMTYFYMRRGSSLAIRNEDLIFKKTKSDFRLNHLYKKCIEHNIQYIEFIRNTSTKRFFINIIKRKRFAIYYPSIIYFVNLFSRKTNVDIKPSSFYESILFSFHQQNIVFIKSIPIFEKIFQIIKIDNLLLISFSSRSAHLAIAAKSLKIKVIGIMHGLSQKEYVVQEFLESYNEDKKIGCDIYGVWSPYYLDYFKKYSKLTKSEGFQYSGLLRPISNILPTNEFIRISTNKIKILLISEPVVSVKEIIPYLECLLKYDNIEIGIKVRPMINDSYLEEMKSQFPLINNLQVYDGKIEDTGKDFDIFLGCCSTAVIEASLIGKLSLMISTDKFGDYFDIDSFMPGESILIKNNQKLYEKIINRVNNEKTLNTVSIIRDRFFGGYKDGTQWIIDQIN
jgi:hypothetical protein